MTTITAENIRVELQERFEDWARTSFARALEAISNATFYKTVLQRLEKGISIADEVPEVEGMKKAEVQKVVMKLFKKAQLDETQTWELASVYKSCFATTIRSAVSADEVLPQYDVEYAGKNECQGAKIKITTRRRNLNVEVVGTDKEVEKLWMHMSHAALTAPH